MIKFLLVIKIPANFTRYSINGKSLESSPSSGNVVDDLKQMKNLQDETEELLAEEYDELDSFEKKEIEEQLSEDITEEFDDESALDVSVDKTTSFSSFDFESLDPAQLTAWRSQ